MSGWEVVGEGIGLAFEFVVDLLTSHDQPRRKDDEPEGPKPVPRSDYEDIA